MTSDASREALTLATSVLFILSVFLIMQPAPVSTASSSILQGKATVSIQQSVQHPGKAPFPFGGASWTGSFTVDLSKLDCSRGPCQYLATPSGTGTGFCITGGAVPNSPYTSLNGGGGCQSLNCVGSGCDAGGCAWNGVITSVAITVSQGENFMYFGFASFINQNNGGATDAICIDSAGSPHQATGGFALLATVNYGKTILANGFGQSSISTHTITQTSGGDTLVETDSITVFIGMVSCTTQTLTDINGGVTVTHQNGVSVKATTGMTLALGDQVLTGSDGSAVVLCSSGSGKPSSIQLGKNSALSKVNQAVDWVCSKGAFFFAIVPQLWGVRIACIVKAIVGVVVTLVSGPPDPGEFSIQLANGSLTVMDFSGIVLVADQQTGASVLLNATQQITLSAGGGTNQTAMTGDVTYFNPSSVNQWWVSPSQLYNSSQTTSSTTALTTAASTVTTGSSASSFTSSGSSSTRSSSLSASTDRGGGIPEFPYQPFVATVFVVLAVVSYLVVRGRRQESSSW